VFGKFHWSPKYGTHSPGVGRGGQDLRRRPRLPPPRLWERIEAGAYPEWELGLQVFTEEEAESFQLRHPDADQDRAEELVPHPAVGPHGAEPQPRQLLRRDRAGRLLHGQHHPGLDFSNDPLLAGRIHSYVDTQISRLGGPNFHEIPINAPIAPVHNNQRDGMHRQAIHRGRVSYEPNSLAGGCPFQGGAAQGFTSVAARLKAREHQENVRAKPELFAEHFNQAACSTKARRRPSRPTSLRLSASS
jgi:catalase